MGRVKTAMMEAEQSAMDAYALKHITRDELVRRLEALHIDHFEATERANLIDEDNRSK